jgi:hypothetical protein
MEYRWEKDDKFIEIEEGLEGPPEKRLAVTWVSTNVFDIKADWPTGVDKIQLIDTKRVERLVKSVKDYVKENDFKEVNPIGKF